MSRCRPGSIVVVDWRGSRLPNEPSKIRPAVVVEDGGLFPDDYPNTLVVPLTGDTRLAHRSFAERIEPNADNGSTSVCWALAHHITTVSLLRVTATDSEITAEQLSSIRRRIVLAIAGA